MPGDECQLTCGIPEAPFVSRTDRTWRARSAGACAPPPTVCRTPTFCMALTVVGSLAITAGLGLPGTQPVAASEPVQTPEAGQGGDSRPDADRPRIRITEGSGGQLLRPGETLSVSFTFEHRSAEPSGGETLPLDHRWRASLRRVVDGQSVELPLPVPVDPDHTEVGPVRWRIRGVVPDRTGVYELKCSLERQHDRGWPLWRRVSTTVAEATCPLIVLPPRSDLPSGDTRGQRLALIQAADSDWPVRWAGEADDGNGSAGSSPETLAWHRIWVAADRLATRSWLVGAQGVVIPGTAEDPRATELAVAVFDSQDLRTLVAMPVVPDSAEEVREWASLVGRLGRHRGFEGLVIEEAGTMISADPLRPLVNSLAGRRLIVMADSAKPDDGPKSGRPAKVVDELFALATSSDAGPHRGIAFSALPEHSLHRHLAWHRRVVSVMDRVDRESEHFRCVKFPPVASVPRAADEPRATPAIGEIGDEVSLRILSRLIHRLDPTVILVPVGPGTGLASDAWSRLLGDFALTPAEMGEIRLPSDPADRTVGLRLRRDEDAMTLAFTNLAPWPVDVEATFAETVSLGAAPDPNERPTGRGSPEKIKELGGGSRAATGISMERRELRLTLGRGGTRVVTVTGKRPELQGWSTRPSGGHAAIKAIHADVSAVFERLGTLSLPPDYPGLTNGDFEIVGEGGVTGWLHAQFPPDAVRVDTGEASRGGRSICLSNSSRSDNRAWLVSEPLPAPASGRLAVSLAYRAASNPAESDHRLRVSMEGSGAEGPFKRSVELAVPRNGLWQSRRLVLEADAIDPEAIPTLRITIDNLSSGSIWVDDVRLHDRFATASEREQMRGQAFLAVQGLQRADLTPACHLLQNFWAGRLLADSAMASASEASEASEADSPADGGRGVAKKFRDWLPRPLRF